jgi:hypothetical protein
MLGSSNFLSRDVCFSFAESPDTPIDVKSGLMDIAILEESRGRGGVESILRSKDTQGLLNILFAYAWMGVRPSEVFLKSWEVESISMLGNCSVEELIKVINSLVYFDNKAGDDFKRSVYDAALCRIDEFSSEQLMSIVTSLRLFGCSLGGEFMLVWEKEIVSALGKLSVGELVEVLEYVSLFGYEPSIEFLRSWNDAAIDKIQDFNKEQLISVMTEFAKLRIRPYQNFLKVWFEEIVRLMPELPPSQLSHVVSILAKSKIEPTIGFLKSFQFCTQDVMTALSSQHLVAIIRSLASLKFVPNKGWQDQWLASARAKFLFFSAVEVSNIFYALGVLDINPNSHFIKSCSHQLCFFVDRVNSNSLAAAVYGTMLLNKASGVEFEGFEDIIKKLVEKLNERKDLNPGSLEILKRASLVYSVQSDLNFQGSESPPIVSGLQSKVFNILNALYPNMVEEEKMFKKIGTSVDLYLDLNDVKIAIQVDGRTHYYQDQVKQNSCTRFNTYLLENFCDVKVLRIPYYDVDGKSDNEMREYLENAIQEIYRSVHERNSQVFRDRGHARSWEQFIMNRSNDASLGINL